MCRETTEQLTDLKYSVHKLCLKTSEVPQPFVYFLILYPASNLVNEDAAFN